ILMPDLDLVRSFLAIYRAGSITRASRAAGLTQPALSGHLRALEIVVGRPLFARRSRGVEATPAGHELARRAAGHIDALETLVAAMRRPTPGAVGALSPGGPAEFTTLRALPALAPLVPMGLELRVVFDLALPLLECLAAGELDLVVATKRSGTRDVTYRPLYEESFVLVGAPAWARVVRAAALARGDVRGLAAVPSSPMRAIYPS